MAQGHIFWVAVWQVWKNHKMRFLAILTQHYYRSWKSLSWIISRSVCLPTSGMPRTAASVSAITWRPPFSLLRKNCQVISRHTAWTTALQLGLLMPVTKPGTYKGDGDIFPFEFQDYISEKPLLYRFVAIWLYQIHFLISKRINITSYHFHEQKKVFYFHQFSLLEVHSFFVSISLILLSYSSILTVP